MSGTQAALSAPTPETGALGDVPAAVPTAPGSYTGPDLVNAGVYDSSVKTTPASPEPVSPQLATGIPRTKIRGRRQLAALSEQLSTRDQEVLHQLAAHRYLNTSQLAGLIFTDHASLATAERVARRVLRRLDRWQLIRPLDRRVGGFSGGSTTAIWQLTSAGARIVQAASGSRYRPQEPSPRVLQHCLAVADAHLTLRDLRQVSGIADVTVQLEPVCWRAYSGLGGEAHWLQPDLAAVVRGADSDGPFEDHWFIEVDLATESVATLHRKCVQYQDYRASGLEQAGPAGVFPLVLWVLHGPRADQRAAQLRAKLGRDLRLDPALYRYATPSTLGNALLGGAS